jgi:MFS transporter, YNFM family, putative membrane transport protein
MLRWRGHEQNVSEPMSASEAGPAEAGEVRAATRHWRAHAAVFAATAGGFCNLYSMQALYPALQDRFGMGVAFAASLLTATTLGIAASAPFAGRFANRFGARDAVLWGVLALAYLTIVAGLVGDGRLLFLLRVVQGLLIPVVLSAVLASTTSLWPEVDASALAASFVTGTVLGGLLGRFIPAALMPFGWTFAFAGFAAVQFAAALAVLLLYPQRRGAAEVLVPLRTWIESFPRILRREIPAQSLGAFGLMFSQAAATTYIAIRLASEPFGWGTTALGALYVVFLPALIFVRLTPRAIAAWGARKTLAIAVGASWLGLIATIPVHAQLILVGLTVFSAAVFVTQTVLAHLVSTVDTARKETTAGIYLSAYYLGASCGALAPAGIWSTYGWLGCLAMIALVQILGLLIAQRTAPESAV